MCLRHGSLVLW